MSTPESEFSASLTLNEEMQGYLAAMARWGRLLAVLGFIFTVALVILAFSMGFIIASLASVHPYMGALPSTGISVLYLILALIYFIPSLYLYRFTVNVQQSLKFKSEAQLAVAFSRLKSFFKFCGLLALFVVIFYLLLLVLLVVIGSRFWGTV